MLRIFSPLFFFFFPYAIYARLTFLDFTLPAESPFVPQQIFDIPVHKLWKIVCSITYPYEKSYELPKQHYFKSRWLDSTLLMRKNFTEKMPPSMFRLIISVTQIGPHQSKLIIYKRDRIWHKGKWVSKKSDGSFERDFFKLLHKKLSTKHSASPLRP